MHPSIPSARRRQKIQLSPEVLETRSLLTGGAGNTFAIVPGTIATAGGSTTVSFTISPEFFTLSKGKLVIGIDVAPQSGSTVQPYISRIDNQHNQLVPQAIHTIYNPHLSHAAVARGAGTRAVLVPLTLSPRQANQPVTYTATIVGQSNSGGGFLTGFYLPGDVDGDGIVNQNDVNLVRSALGSKAGDSRYNFDADVNRDGRIGPIDVSYTRQNMGVKTMVTPLVSLNLDPASTIGNNQRITTQSNVHFTGQDTPGATLKFEAVDQTLPAVSTTTDSLGNFSITVPVGAGTNTFKVTSVDGFGQTISGQIAPVLRQ